MEKIIEANTLLSGIGFESAGLAGAHAIHNGLTVLEGCHGMYHGEKVAFGTITQLVLENVDEEELEEVIFFCIDVGLPVTFEELGIGNVTDEELRKVALTATAEGDTIHNLPSPVTVDSVVAALKAADVKCCVLYAPPSETNFGGALLTGSQSACKAACDAFAYAVEAVADRPIE